MKRILIALALMAPIPAFADEATQTVLDFRGELVDQNAAPVSGVLPLEFRIYADAKSKKVLATEKYFVAVVDGTYTVTLGEASELKTKSDKLVVSVMLDGKELTRQEVSTKRQVVASNPRIVRTETAGSQGGSAFSLNCPEGYVVTGIEGDTKQGIESLRAVCSQVR